MTPNGEFVRAPSTGRLPPGAWPIRVGIGAAAIAAVAGAIAVAALFLWIASLLLPIAIVAGAVAYGAFRYQNWRRTRQSAKQPVG